MDKYVHASLDSLRRPITVDEHAFWYISLAKWHALLAEARDEGKTKQQRKVALNNLRKTDTAGRIMETDEGVAATAPCSWCRRGQGTPREMECRVFKNREDTPCGYCKRMGKAGCTAKHIASLATSQTRQSEYATVQRVAELEERLARAEALLRRSGRSRRLPLSGGSDDEDDIGGNTRQQSETLQDSHDGNDIDMASDGDSEDPGTHVKPDHGEGDQTGRDESPDDGPDMHSLTTFCYNGDNASFELISTRRNLGVSDVLIKTTHSGVCYTDVHAKDKGCGLGHEGVGIVEAVGQAVTHLRVGERVGWGWLHSSCGHCTTCVTGYRQYCAEARGFAFSDLDQGAFSDYRIIDSAFAYRIPDAIDSVDAGPFMCAGASVFEALDAAGTKPDGRVGVVGIGGLGHMAALFAKAMGCAVTAFSSSDSKLDDALELGADEFRLLGDIGNCYRSRDGEGDYRCEQDPQPMNINTLLITSNAVPNLEPIMPLLARRATIVLMTIQPEPLSIPYMPFILPGHRLIASTEASRENHIKMLDFAARHQIKPWIEKFAMTAGGMAKAFGRLEDGQMRYRGVLVREQEDASPLSDAPA